MLHQTHLPPDRHGALAQLARALHWQCRGQGFESPMLHFLCKESELRGGSDSLHIDRLCNLFYFPYNHFFRSAMCFPAKELPFRSPSDINSIKKESFVLHSVSNSLTRFSNCLILFFFPPPNRRTAGAICAA